MLHGLCFGEEAGAQNLVFFPTLTCGVFVFSAVSAPSPPASSRLSTHTHIPHSHTHHFLTHTHPTNTHSLTHSHTHTSLTHTHTSLTHTHIPQTLTPDNVRCQGVRCSPRCPSGVPWSPPLCRWLLRGRRGTMCTAKGSDVLEILFFFVRS